MSSRFLIKTIVLLISISGITRFWFSTQTYATALSLVLNYLAIGIILKLFYSLPKIRLEKKRILQIYLVYAIIILIYSLFVTESFEQSRYVITVYAPSLILPIIAILASKPIISIYFLKYFLTLSIPLSIFLYFFDFEGMSDFTHYISFIYVFILLIPYLKWKWKIIIITVTILSFLYSLESRSNLINISFVFVLMLVSHFKNEKVKKTFKTFGYIFMFSPFIFVLSAIFLNFNVFSYGDEFKNDFKLNGENGTEIFLSNDSRTPIYADAVSTIINKNAYLFGLSAAGFHKTSLKDVELDGYFEFYRKGRLGSEAGILEYLLRGGLIFVLIVTLVYFFALKHAFLNPNNHLIIVFGVYIGFRFFYMFIESQPALNLFNMSTFIVIGLCLSTDFMKMNDKQIKYNFNRIMK